MQRLSIAGVGLWLVLSSCADPRDDSLEEESDSAEIKESFAALYSEVFSVHHCTGCHGAKAPGKLSLATPSEAYGELVDIEAGGGKCAPVSTIRVVPGDASASLLIHKLEGHDASNNAVCGSSMPQQQLLSAGEIARVRAWIEQGALDN